MKSLFNCLILVIFFLPQANFAQSEPVHEWGAILNVNAGLTGYHYSDMENNLGNLDPLPERWSAGSFEVGTEAFLVLKKHFLFRGNYFNTWSFGFSVADFDGKWSAGGGSIGLGYAYVEKANTFYILPSLSLGIINGNLELDATNNSLFGEDVIEEGSIQEYTINNPFLDLNVHFGKMLKLGQSERAFGLTPAFSVGYKMSLKRGEWSELDSGREVNGVAKSLLYGWYIKFGIGIGGFWS